MYFPYIIQQPIATNNKLSKEPLTQFQVLYVSKATSFYSVQQVRGQSPEKYPIGNFKSPIDKGHRKPLSPVFL